MWGRATQARLFLDFVLWGLACSSLWKTKVKEEAETSSIQKKSLITDVLPNFAQHQSAALSGTIVRWSQFSAGC
jgi:hypothetical protein